MDHLAFHKAVLKTNCKSKSAPIKSLKIEKRKNQLTQMEGREGEGEGGRGRGRGGRGGGERGRKKRKY